MYVPSSIKKASKISSEDLLGRAFGILSIFIKDPQFQGQTKEKLSSPKTQKSIESSLKDHFEVWLNNNMEIPRYINVDIHLKPGGYFAELCKDDIFAGAEYERTTYLNVNGLFGPKMESLGEVVSNWVKIKNKFCHFSPLTPIDNMKY